MSSADAASTSAERDGRPPAKGVRALLDMIAGFFVWGAHLLLVYGATAVACQFGIGRASSAGRTTFLIVLVALTLAMAGLVLLHAWRRYRQLHDHPDARFRMTFTIGNDAVAALAILWQILALTIVPLCA